MNNSTIAPLQFKDNYDGQPMLACVSGRAPIFGYMSHISVDDALYNEQPLAQGVLKCAHQALGWSENLGETNGEIIELARVGPNPEAIITARSEIIYFSSILQLITVSPEAEKRWHEAAAPTREDLTFANDTSNFLDKGKRAVLYRMDHTIISGVIEGIQRNTLDQAGRPTCTVELSDASYESEWSEEVGSALGLATNGPDPKAPRTPRNPNSPDNTFTATDVHAIATMSDQAVAAWTR